MQSTPHYTPELGKLNYEKSRLLALYKDAGLTAIPLTPGSKQCRVKGWQKRQQLELWARAPEDANVGLRCGDGELSIIDADDFPTAEIVWRKLEGLGVDPAGVMTPDGFQFYHRTPDVPEHVTVLKLKADGLTGELRLKRAYGATAPSVVGNWHYVLFGEIQSRAQIDLADLLRMLGLELPAEKPLPEETGWRPVLRIRLPREAYALAEQIQAAVPGERVGKYRTRSEALGWLFDWCLMYGLTEREAANLVGPLQGRPLIYLAQDAGRIYRKRLHERRHLLLLAQEAASLPPSTPSVEDMGHNYPKHAGGRPVETGTADILRAAALLAYQAGEGFLMHGTQVAQIAKVTDRTARRYMAKLAEGEWLLPGKRGRYRGYFVNSERSGGNT